MGTPELSKRQLATVLAALRYWQREGLLSDSCAEGDIATDAGRFVSLNKKEIDALCEKLNPIEYPLTEDFKVAAVSSNLNSFGLQQMILISRGGEGWKACANSINVKKKGATIRVSIDRRTGEPEWGRLGFEIPERIRPNAPHKVVEGAWK